ncbi:hypothetical protein Tco_0071257 [Tanacetum coccineum]
MKDDEAKDDDQTKKSGKRRKQMARKGLHTSVDKNDSEDSEQDDSVTGLEVHKGKDQVRGRIVGKIDSVSDFKLVVALTEAEQMELDTKRSLIQTHSSYTSGSGTDKGTGDKPRVPDIPTYGFDDEQISWKSSDEEDDDDVAMSDDDDNNDDDQNDDNTDNEGDDQDDDNEQTESDNDDDDIVHPKLSTFDEEQRKDEEDKE